MEFEPIVIDLKKYRQRELERLTDRELLIYLTKEINQVAERFNDLTMDLSDDFVSYLLELNQLEEIAPETFNDVLKKQAFQERMSKISFTVFDLIKDVITALEKRYKQ